MPQEEEQEGPGKKGERGRKNHDTVRDTRLTRCRVMCTIRPPIPSFLPSFPPSFFNRNCTACPTNEPCSDTETRVSTFFGKLAKLFPYLLLLRPRVRIPFFSFFSLSSTPRDSSPLLLSGRNVASSSLFFVVGRRSRQSRSRSPLFFSSLLFSRSSAMLGSRVRAP